MTTHLRTETVSELRHELRTPVNLIVGYAEMLGEDLDADDARMASIDAILQAAHVVLERINAALPGTGLATEGDLARLLRDLVEPQRRVLDATRALLASPTDEQFAADLAKIAAAAERLTAPPHPAVKNQYTPGPSVAIPGTPVNVAHGLVTQARILVVDDVEENRAVLDRRLSRQGHRVAMAENGRVALARLAAESFDLVLLDVLMPEVDGFEVLERMKASPALRDIPVIMISALDDLASVVRCVEHGAEDYLPKPFDPVLLRARIGAALEKKRFRDREADYLRQVGRVIEAAGAVERGQYASELLLEISRRDDELGRLARVFDTMVAGVRAREGRLREQLRELRDDVFLATRESSSVLPAADETGLLAPGSTFAGRYEICHPVGNGGMGMVYCAIDRELGDEVALKLLRPELLAGDESAVERFKNEIRLARRISHRNVVRTHDIGESDGAYFVTMEYVRGITVRELLTTRGRLGVSSTMGIARQLVEALAVAHDAGVVHRDVKPENALLGEDGVLKVMDFGIARLAQRTSNLTQAGMLVGTPAYMAPEQLLGEDVDGRTDLYAVGVVMYECLTGALPFTAPSPIAMISKVLMTEPPAAVSVNAEVPPALSALVARLLAKTPDARPAHARQLLELLAELG